MNRRSSFFATAPRTVAGVLGCSVAAVALTLSVAAMAGAAPEQTVSTLSVVLDQKKEPPASGRLGLKSGPYDGPLLDASGQKQIGTWRFRCSYLGGQGERLQDSHFCTFLITVKGSGSITSSGGIGMGSDAPRWLAITGGTGAYKGAFGTSQLKRFTNWSTPLTYYVMR